MALNIITAKFCSGSTQTWTAEAWQYDYGQVLLIEDVELPEAYEVHFSNMPIKGTAKPQIGNADGVTIPDEYFESGEPIYAWLFLHQGENDGETEKMITIPVKKRSKVVNEQPTPVEQSAITQAIAALNIAVEKAEDAIEHYPQIIDGTWHVWDVTAEEYVDTGVEAQGEQGQPGTDGTDGQDGFSPVITVTDITGGHRVTITTATGTQTVDVMNGQPGTPGTDGTDGYSPTVTVTEITGGHRVTITDAQGAHTFDVMDGQGSSITVDSALSTTSENPVQNKVITGAVNQLNEDLSELSSSIAPVESSATATAAHAVGELFMLGGTLMVALSAIAIGDTITTEGGSPNAAVTKLTDKLLKDVQVNGTSVVSQGVANVPLAGSNTLGTIKASNTFGVQMGATSSTNEYLMTCPPSENQIKSPGTDNPSTYRPITPRYQHQSVFYGLAKAASDTTQSASSNAVGNYTDAAKVAIQKMLGIYEAPWELIREDTITNTTEADVEIAVDDNGQPFELTDLYLEVWLDALESTPANVGSYGQVQAFYGTASNITSYFGVTTIAVGGATRGAVLLIRNVKGAIIIQYTQYTATGNSYANLYTQPRTNINRSLLSAGDFVFGKIVIKAITGKFSYRLYGKRKWS